MSAGGKTVWGNPSDIGTVLEGSSFDVVLDNNGKDLDAVRFVVTIHSFYYIGLVLFSFTIATRITN